MTDTALIRRLMWWTYPRECREAAHTITTLTAALQQIADPGGDGPYDSRAIVAYAKAALEDTTP